MCASPYIVQCYGITKDPETKEFVMVMSYHEQNRGSMRQHLNNWYHKVRDLAFIAHGLYGIHENGLIHRDFHRGNILKGVDWTTITDLGVCKPANVTTHQGDDKKIYYGVLPYVAPEDLRGKEYTQASDIYGFGIIAHELCTGFPPHHDIAHDELLAIRICQGLRPKSNNKIPQLIFDVIKQCWNADPLKRPKAKELDKLFGDLYFDVDNENQVLINEQIKEAEEANKKLFFSTTTSLSTDILSYTTHAQAVYTSRLLDFKNLPEPKNADDNETEYTGN